MDYNLLAFIVLSLVILGTGAHVASRRTLLVSSRLLMVALALRIVGSAARYEVLERFYNGVGDAGGYYQFGLGFAQRLWSGDLSVFGYQQWFGGGLGGGWGTQFLKNVSGIVVTFVGPSMRAEFLAFSMLAFFGLYCIVAAFAEWMGRERARMLATVVFLWPSLWFWPASVGKESLVLLGIGLAFLGVVGRNGLYRKLPLAVGLLLVFFVRAHVAMLFVGSLAFGHWITSFRRLDARRVLEAVALVVVLFVVVQTGAERIGLFEADLEGITEFISVRSAQTMQGGGNIGGTPTGLLALPMALVNLWMRPFIWEVHNATALFSALEVLLFWYLIVLRFPAVKASLLRWRRDRLISFLVPLLAGYTLMLGLTFANLGIIARQRAIMYAFVFMLPVASAVPARRSRAPGRPTIGEPSLGREGAVSGTPTR